MSTGSSPFESADGTISCDLLLPDSLRGLLGRAFGTLISGDLSEELGGCRRLISVGDIVTATLLRLDLRPDLMIFDFRSQRAPCEELGGLIRDVEGRTVRVRNPSGMIAKELWNAVASALTSRIRTKIAVDGEEDLASLACIALSDEGDCVIYGIPDRGIALIRIDSRIRKTVREILEQMTPAD